MKSWISVLLSIAKIITTLTICFDQKASNISFIALKFSFICDVIAIKNFPSYFHSRWLTHQKNLWNELKESIKIMFWWKIRYENFWVKFEFKKILKVPFPLFELSTSTSFNISSWFKSLFCVEICIRFIGKKSAIMQLFMYLINTFDKDEFEEFLKSFKCAFDKQTKKQKNIFLNILNLSHYKTSFRDICNWTVINCLNLNFYDMSSNNYY